MWLRPFFIGLARCERIVSQIADRGLRDLIAGPFSEAEMDVEVDRVYNLIRNDVYNDTRKEYTNQEFDDKIIIDLPDWTSSGRIFGIKPFVGRCKKQVLGQLP